MLGTAAVLTVAQAAELLPWRREVAARWLRHNRLVRAVVLDDPEHPGRVRREEVVVWGSVIRLIEAGSMPGEERPVSRRGATLERERL